MSGDTVGPNPYTPGELPRVLAGRLPQLEQARDRLARVSTFGEFAGPVLVYYGPRGVGKTSLLRAVQREAEQLGFLSAWIACSRRQPFLPDVISRVSRALDRWDVLDRNAHAQFHVRLARITTQFGVPGASVAAEFRPEAAPSESTGSPAMSAIEDLLHDAASTIRTHGGAGLVVFLDEIHAAHKGDLAVLLNALQNVAGASTDTPLTVLAAGLPSSPGWITSAATFGERSAFVNLPRLDLEASIEAVTRPASDLDVSWADDAVRTVAEEAEGFPYLLQVHAAAVWASAAPTRGSTITAEHVVAARPEIADRLEALYRARWDAASNREQDFLVAMAEDSTDPDQPVERAHIAEALDVQTRALSVPRDRLIEKGIIEPAGHGRLRFTIPGFGEYVRRVGR